MSSNDYSKVDQLIGKISRRIEMADVHYWACRLTRIPVNDESTDSLLLSFPFIFRCTDGSILESGIGWFLREEFNLEDIDARIKAAISIVLDESRTKKLILIEYPGRFGRLDWELSCEG